MENQELFRKQVKVIFRFLRLIYAFALVLMIGGLYLIVDPTLSMFKKTTPDTAYTVSTVEDEDKIIDGIHVRTGFVDAEGLMAVVNNCTNCHSPKLVIQNRMNRERWITTIRWMQETQNLWDLGENEEIIIKYLVTNYPPKKKGRRESLTNIDWYDLQN